MCKIQISYAKMCKSNFGWCKGSLGCIGIIALLLAVAAAWAYGSDNSARAKCINDNVAIRMGQKTITEYHFREDWRTRGKGNHYKIYYAAVYGYYRVQDNNPNTTELYPLPDNRCAFARHTCERESNSETIQCTQSLYPLQSQSTGYVRGSECYDVRYETCFTEERLEKELMVVWISLMIAAVCVLLTCIIYAIERMIDLTNKARVAPKGESAVSR
jgi:hypothetical protein